MSVTSEANAGHSSFRDPAGFVLHHQGRVLRSVNRDVAAAFEEFCGSRTAREAVEAGELVRTEKIAHRYLPEVDARDGVLFEHERIPFVSYPYEWPAAMLAKAGRLTLALAEGAIEEGFGLKDATPYNVLFRGSQAVFVDVLSFEKRDPLDAMWMAYGQFVRTFLLPLAAERTLGTPACQTLAAHRDGLEPEQMYRWLGAWRRWTPPLLGLVTIPKWLGSRSEGQVAAAIRRERDPAKARFVLRGLLRSCGKQLEKLAPRREAESAWSGYLDRKSLYTAEQLRQKERFVREALHVAGPNGSRPCTTLDVGANEGHFSFLAARTGVSVVAIDSDPAVVGSMYRRAAAESLDVLPLVVDLARPTPAAGWRNGECASFLDRARGRFDLVLMLAVIHHLLVTERIPLEEVLSLVSELSRDYVVIEYVAPEDPMFQKIARGRERLYVELTRVQFEAAAERRFEIVRREEIAGMHRCLYLLRRR